MFHFADSIGICCLHKTSHKASDQRRLNKYVEVFDAERRMAEKEYKSGEFPWQAPAFNFKLH